MLNLVEIIPGLSLVTGENNGRFPFSHSFLVKGTATALVDTGCGASVMDALLQEREIDFVIASHGHPDHTALNWKFAGKPIYAPEYASDTFGNFDLLGDRFADPGELASEWRQFVSTAMNFRTALPTHTYIDGHIFDFGAIKLVAIHTPGHTVDHTCFFEPTHGIVFSFDIDLTSFGPWYGHRESDIAAFEESIRKIMSLKPRLVVSSHKGMIADDIEHLFQRYLHVVDARDRILLDLITRPKTVDELTDLMPFYQGRPYAEKLLHYWEGQMVSKHLARLVERGQIVETPDGKFAIRKT